MQWDREKTLLFIDRYREKPNLWDPRHEHHYNKLKKNDAWKELADEMGTDVEECKKKISSLLASLRREKGKIKKSSGTGKGTEEVYTSTWFAYKPLQFVLDRNIPRTTEDTMQETTTDIQENSEGTQSQAETQSFVINEVTDVPKNSDNVQKSKKRKQTNPDEIMTSAFNILKATSERNQSVTTNSRPPDECETYGAFIGNKLRLYTPRTRSYVQHHFSEIMFNADLGQYEYENTPGQNNEHPTNRYPCSDSYSGYGYSTTPSPATSNTHYSTTDNSQQVRDNYLQAIDKQPIVNSPHAMDNSQQVTGYSQQAAASSDSCHSKISDELTDDFNDLLH